jgi:hypothetical protein
MRVVIGLVDVARRARRNYFAEVPAFGAKELKARR